MKVGMKISMALFAMLFLLCLLGFSSYYSSSGIQDDVHDILRSYQIATLASQAEYDFLNAALNGRRYLGDNQPQYKAAVADKLESVVTHGEKLHDISPEEDREKIRAIISDTLRYREGVLKQVFPLHEAALATANDPAAYAEFRQKELAVTTEYTILAQSILDRFRLLGAGHHRAVADNIATADAEARRVATIAFGLSAFAVIIGAALSYALTRMVTDPVHEMTRQLETMALGVFKGDSSSATTQRSDEFGSMAKSLQKLDANTRTLLDRIGEHEVLLRERERKYRDLFEQSLDGIVSVDTDGQITGFNKAFLTITGYSEKELSSMKVADIAHSTDERTPLFTELSPVSIRYQGLFQVELKDRLGRQIPAEVSVFPQFDDNGLRIGMWAICRDITQRRQTESVLREIAAGVAATTGTDFFTSLMRYFVDAFGVRYAFISSVNGEECSEAQTLSFFSHGEPAPNFSYSLKDTPCEQVFTTGQVCFYNTGVAGLFPNDKALQEKGLESYLGVALRDSKGICIGHIALLDDRPLTNPEIMISILQIYAARAAAELERQKHESRVRFLAYHDDATQLGNRWQYIEWLDEFLRKPGRPPFAVITLCLDDFTLFSNVIGYDASSAYLSFIATRLRTLLDKMCPSCRLARVGDDRFGLLLSVPMIEKVAGKLAQNLIRTANSSWKHNERELSSSASIGISIFPQDGSTSEELLLSAEHALSHIQERSRGSHQFFNPSLRVDLLRKVELQNEIKRALENGEFLLHYQPQYDTYTQRLIGAEALIRWNHPQRGMIPPAEFIPPAEESGLILQLGDWVVRAACDQLRDWLDAGLDPVRVAVNISALQFEQPSFVETVRGSLARNNLPASLLELELTESIAMTDARKMGNKMAELALMGLSLSIDDFGTGYSSLAYLKAFPIQTLKIDRSFIADVDRNPGNSAIVSAMIALAHNLDLKVVAEGVETQAHLDFLRSKGCDYLQGYLLGRPIPPELFTELL